MDESADKGSNKSEGETHSPPIFHSSTPEENTSIRDHNMRRLDENDDALTKSLINITVKPKDDPEYQTEEVETFEDSSWQLLIPEVLVRDRSENENRNVICNTARISQSRQVRDLAISSSHSVNGDVAEVVIVTPVRSGRLSPFTAVLDGFSIQQPSDRISVSTSSSNGLGRPSGLRGQGRARHSSLCRVTGVSLSSESSDPLLAHNNASSDEEAIITDSVDSHCHTNQKKNKMDKNTRTKLIIASVLCTLFMIGEMAGGLLAHSLAIISDAAHLFTDFASFMIALMALYLANKPATKKLNFGWYRAEILGALTSILLLWVMTGILVYLAVNRVIDDNYEINASIMLVTAASGVAFNILLGTTLHQHSHSHGRGGQGHSHDGGSSPSSHLATNTHNASCQPMANSVPSRNYGSISNVEQGHSSPEDNVSAQHEDHGHIQRHEEPNINVKAAFIHVIGDLFQSIGVLVAGFIIYFRPEWKIADPICTFMFSLFVLITTVTIMKDILVVLMEGSPQGMNFAEVRGTFLDVEDIMDIHNLRVWSLTMDKIALSVHLVIKKTANPHEVLQAASKLIQQRFNISETTIQIEEYVTDMDDCNNCKSPTN